MKIVPSLSFKGQCREAFEFYAEVLGGQITAAFPYGEGPPDFPPLKRGEGKRRMRAQSPMWRLRVAAAVSATVASTMAVPAVRLGARRRTIPGSAAEWLLIRIPIGTVWSEEAAFRAALGTVAAQCFGPRWGRVLQAAAFGLSHVVDARGAGETVAGTVAVTGAAGWVFGWLYDRSGSIAAPMLAHLAVNEAGAVAALTVQTSRLSAWSR
jgi:membrane protease YdiL (CAAX protease family)